MSRSKRVARPRSPYHRTARWSTCPSGPRQRGWCSWNARDGEIRWQSADASGAAELLAVSDGGAYMSPAGGFFVTDRGGGGNIDMISLDDPHRRTSLVRGSSAAAPPRISPDGHWLAQSSSQSGRPEVYVRPITGSGLHQVSAQGGAEPVWGPNGH